MIFSTAPWFENGPAFRVALFSLLAGLVFSITGCATPDTATAKPATPPPARTEAPPPPAILPPQLAPAAQDTPWPRTLRSGDLTFKVHQPQPEKWDGLRLTGLAAVSVQKDGAPKAEHGVLKLAVNTVVDKGERLVYLSDLEITEALFPGDANRGRAYAARLKELVPKEIKTISLDRLETTLATIQEKRQAGTAARLKNTPPRFVFSTKPAMLIRIEGKPVYRPVEGIALESVLNTHAVVLRDAAGRHYLHLFDGFMEAPALSGPWAVSAQPPVAAAQAAAQLVKARGADLLEGPQDPATGKRPSLKETAPPAIHIAEVPTELIVTTGEPRYVAIAGGALEYVENTTGNIFRDRGTGKIFVLTSGRWFRAASLQGPWEFVPASQLPADFARIPDDSPKENVKASIPKTPQAQEARIANSIPNMARVPPSQTTMAPLAIDGEPEIKPIPGTSLSYVVNTPAAVIRVSDKQWYALDKGVWFTAAGLNGPWKVADSVPAVIYAIPPESPLHYVTYVRIYGVMDDGDILVGYTPGYYGTVVSADGTVVYGTGYSYPAYVSNTVYVSQPSTYGCGCDMAWTPWGGWAFGFAMGWAIFDDDYYHHYHYGYYPPAPRWGPYGAYWNEYGGATAWGPGGWAGTTGNVYRQRGDWSGVTRGSAGYNAYTGNEWARQYGRAYNSRTGTQAAGHRGTVNNVYTGQTVSGGRVVGYNPNTGQVGSAAGVRGDSGAALRVGDDVYAGRNGNVYKRDGGDWSQVSGQSASSVRDSRQVNSLNQSYGGRELGSQRYDSFQASRPPSGSVQRSYNSGGARSGGFSGGMRGGGGARGGGGRGRGP